jgi:pimeloyl-ACP methyl ester carboxylesterase
VLNVITMGRQTVSAESVPPGRFVNLPGRGTTFVVDVAGPRGAPTLLLLHGLAVTGYLNWFPAFAPLSADFRVVAMDMRGHGRGIGLRRRFRLADCADDAAVLADVLELDRVVPVGYSLGGPVAQLLWKRHPDRVAGMVLCATSRNFGGTPQERWFYQTLVGAVFALRAARSLPGPLHRVPVDHAALGWMEPVDIRLSQWARDEMRLASPEAVLQAMHAMGRFSSHTWVRDIDVPTGVVITTQDRFIAADRQLKLARAIRGATIHPTHAGHTACVVGSKRFVPSLVEACHSVADRLGAPSATTASSAPA